MTVSTTTYRADYTGNGSTTAFTIPFYFVDNTHVQVIRTQVSTNVVTTLVLNTDYTVTGAGVAGGGTATLTVAPTTDQKVSILRNVPFTQNYHYVPNDPFPAASHEAALDLNTMQAQQLYEITNRAVVLSSNQSGVSTTMPTPSANNFIGWNSEATALQNVDPSTLVTIAGSNNFYYQTFNGDGSTTSFTLSSNPGVVGNINVYISGVAKLPVTDFNISGTTLTFTSAPAIGTNNILVRWAQTLGVYTVGDGTVTPAKLSTGGPTWDTSGNFTANATGYMRVAVGTTAQRPAGSTGQLRFNTTTNAFEGFYNSAWSSFGGSTSAAGSNGQIQYNNAGAFAGSANYTFDGNNVTLAGTLAMASSFVRNRLINGGFAIDQRNAGASQTITAAAALAYTVDRWYAYCTGANVSGQQVANTGTTASPSQKAYQFTGAASVTGIGFAQRIEAINSYDLAGSTATLSVNLSNSLLTTVNWTAYYANTADTFGTLASPTRTQIATGSFTVTSTLTRYSTNITIPAAATTGIEIVFTVGAQISGTWVIGNAQLEAGTVQTAFERRLNELQLAQRYYCKTTSAFVGNSYAAGFVYDGRMFFKVTMRSIPTLDTGAAYTVGGGSAGTVALFGTGSSDVVTFYNSASNWTIGTSVSVTAGFTSEL